MSKLLNYLTPVLSVRPQEPTLFGRTDRLINPKPDSTERRFYQRLGGIAGQNLT
ncbi:hypothetical protein [Mucilaginibacter pedocola]|uniref:hypothetical protein n=1 Tax=Mucilaginibacter pedocola TaxID=1792845 RepID=UPI0012DF2190|nr:hypothetical protein [Mucilaginibacter pedocola]